MYEYYVPRLPPPGTISTSGKGVDKAENEKDNLIRAIIITVVVVIIVIVVAYYIRINYLKKVRINNLKQNLHFIRNANKNLILSEDEVQEIFKKIEYFPVNTTKLPFHSYCLYDKKNVITNCHVAHGHG